MKKFNVSLSVEKNIDLEVKVIANNADDAVIKAAQLFVSNNEDGDIKTVVAYTENVNANGLLETTAIVVKDDNEFDRKNVIHFIDENDGEPCESDEDDIYDEENFFEESLRKMFMEICEHCPHSEGCKRKEKLE